MAKCMDGCTGYHGEDDFIPKPACYGFCDQSPEAEATPHRIKANPKKRSD
jgi:hypothetical protein